METLNAAVLSELQSFMDEDEFVAFMESAKHKLQHQGPLLLAYLTDHRSDEARRLAHRLKGTMGSLGCDRLAATLNIFEQELRQSPPLRPQAQCMAELELTIQATLSALQQRCEFLAKRTWWSSSQP
jgi:HPt (histidine-containing phosphotransfer) domain-containing protein